MCGLRMKIVQGVQEKLCFFTFHCNPSLAYIAVRDLQSSQRNVSVQSLLLAGHFCTTNSRQFTLFTKLFDYDNHGCLICRMILDWQQILIRALLQVIDCWISIRLIGNYNSVFINYLCMAYSHWAIIIYYIYNILYYNCSMHILYVSN